MVCSGIADGSCTRLGDAFTAGCAGVQAVGQHVHGADQQMPQGGARETCADAEDGELLGYVAQINDRHYAALGAAGEGAAARWGGTGTRLVSTLTTSPLSGP